MHTIFSMPYRTEKQNSLILLLTKQWCLLELCRKRHYIYHSLHFVDYFLSYNHFNATLAYALSSSFFFSSIIPDVNTLCKVCYFTMNIGNELPLYYSWKKAHLLLCSLLLSTFYFFNSGKEKILDPGFTYKKWWCYSNNLFHRNKIKKSNNFVYRSEYSIQKLHVSEKKNWRKIKREKSAFFFRSIFSFFLRFRCIFVCYDAVFVASENCSYLFYISFF